MPLTNFGILVRSELSKRGWQQKDLAKIIEVSDSYLSDILYGKRNPDTLKSKIIKVLDLDQTLI